MAFQVENLFKNPALFDLQGYCYLTESTDPPGPGVDPPSAPPANVIQAPEQQAYVHFVFRATGWGVPLLNPANKWRCQVYIESFGKGEVNADPTPVNMTYSTTNGHIYHGVIPLSAFNLGPGAYKLIATRTLVGATGRPTPIAAHEEMGVLQVYTDGV